MAQRCPIQPRLEDWSQIYTRCPRHTGTPGRIWRIPKGLFQRIGQPRTIYPSDLYHSRQVGKGPILDINDPVLAFDEKDGYILDGWDKRGGESLTRVNEQGITLEMKDT